MPQAAAAPRLIRCLCVAALTAALGACAGIGGRDRAGGIPRVTDPAPIVSGTMRPYQVRGRWYRPSEQPDYDQTGLASWYGDAFNGRPTATGERFDMNALTAAHKTLPLPALVEVTNLENGRRVVLRVNDRGPFVDDRIIDLSRGAATELGLIQRGVGRVRVRYVGPAPRIGGGVRLQQASAEPAQRPTPDQRFWVQAAAFASREAAAITASDLGQASVQSADVGGRPMFRVVMGPWSDANSAEQARQGVVARGFRDALLISGR
ncbi:MAG: septal ring lytic transglycosylase RlpA family protein [Alphaproteobacteria bacterium]|nr:MAG: septal ring lytic transglycosylase RlpA family protein [Alphaproteobacteria bacterium]